MNFPDPAAGEPLIDGDGDVDEGDGDGLGEAEALVAGGAAVVGGATVVGGAVAGGGVTGVALAAGAAPRAGATPADTPAWAAPTAPAAVPPMIISAAASQSARLMNLTAIGSPFFTR